MDEMEFTRAYLGEHKTRGDEIIAKTCPFCHGGQHGQVDLFDQSGAARI